MQRVVSLEAGVAMVVTDLHGDWDAYRRCRDRFADLSAHGQADYYILTGDLIHGEGPPHSDRSLDILLDVLALQRALGDRLIYLLGNHELPHIYGITLQKGDRLYTPDFEAAMDKHRAAILSLFESLPFYVRTRAGVSICHAGASSGVGRLFDYSHRRVLDEAAASAPVDRRPSLRAGIAKLSGARYEDLARYYLAVLGPDDPRYDDLLMGNLAQALPAFEALWMAFFTYNEREYGDRYRAILADTLQELSAGFHRQEVMVTGHLACRGGYTVVNEQQLRLASGAHAYPRQSARYLLLDVARPVHLAEELLPGLGSVFKP